MDKAIVRFKKLVGGKLPQCALQVDAPDQPEGIWWLDITHGKKRHTFEYRPGKGFGLFDKDAEYGEGPSEIYRTPDRAVRRLAQLMTRSDGKRGRLNLKALRELYGHSQVTLAKKVGVKQSAISRFENRDEIKFSTLAAAIKALGGILEVRAHFSDAEVAVSLPTSKK